MTGFGDADKLAAAKELQRSFATRSGPSQGSFRKAIPQNGRVASTRGEFQTNAVRGGPYTTQNAANTRDNGRGPAVGRSSVISPATTATNVRRDPAPRASSRAGDLTTEHLTRSVTFGRLSSKPESNPVQVNPSGGTSSVGGLANSRFASESPAADYAGSGNAKVGIIMSEDEVRKLQSGRMVGFYQSPKTEDDWKWVPDEPNANQRGNTGRFSRRPDPKARPFVSSKHAVAPVTMSSVDIDSVNPRYTGYYQETTQTQTPAVMQSSSVAATFDQSSTPRATHDQSSEKPSHSPTTQGIMAEGLTEKNAVQPTLYSVSSDLESAHPDLRKAYELYLELTAMENAGDAMEIDEEL